MIPSPSLVKVLSPFSAINPSMNTGQNVSAAAAASAASTLNAGGARKRDHPLVKKNYAGVGATKLFIQRSKPHT
jgi:hypothetical protein